jgi:NADPH-dependent F420 reductase
MNIAVIGTGNVGSVLGSRWAQNGHNMVFGSREPSSPKVQELLQRSGANARATTVAEAIASAEVVVLTTPWGTTEAIIKSIGDWRNKILIDCTNPLAKDLSGLMVGQTTSAGELTAEWARGARVVKAFNNTGAGNMANPVYGDTAATMFICGDDPDAKKVVGELATDLGFEVADAGGLVMARYIEPLAMLWIRLAYVQGLGPNIAFKLLKR